MVYERRQLQDFVDWLVRLPSLRGFFADGYLEEPGEERDGRTRSTFPWGATPQIVLKPSRSKGGTSRGTAYWIQRLITLRLDPTLSEEGAAEMVIHEVCHFCSDEYGRLIGNGGHRDNFYRLLIRVVKEAYPGIAEEEAHALKDVWKIRHRYRKDDAITEAIGRWAKRDILSRAALRDGDGKPMLQVHDFVPMRPGSEFMIIANKRLMAAGEALDPERIPSPEKSDPSPPSVFEILPPQSDEVEEDEPAFDKDSIRSKREEIDRRVLSILRFQRELRDTAGPGIPIQMTVPEILRPLADSLFAGVPRRLAHYEVWASCNRLQKRGLAYIERRKGGCVICSQ